MSDEARQLILLASKPLIYGWLLALPRLWLPPERRPSRWGPVWGAGIRFILGWLVGLPVALLSFRLGAVGNIVALTLVRLGLWFLTARLCYRTIPSPRLLAFSAGGTAVNWIFDLTLFEGYWGNANFGRC